MVIEEDVVQRAGLGEKRRSRGAVSSESRRRMQEGHVCAVQSCRINGSRCKAVQCRAVQCRAVQCNEERKG